MKHRARAAAAGIFALLLALCRRGLGETQSNGLVQVDWVIHRQSSQDELDPATRAPLNEDRVILRRGRFGVSETRGPFGAHLEIDANSLKGPLVRPFEAFVFAQHRGQASGAELGGRLSAGLLSIPFGFDARETETVRPLLERADGTRAFFGQARDLGLEGELWLGITRLSVAMMNGQPLSDDRYAGLSLTRGKDYLARVGVATPRARGVWVEAGVSCLFGTGLHLGTAATKDSLQWVDGNEDGQVDATELVPIAGAPATASRTYPRSALGADLQVGIRLGRLGLLTLRAELTRAVNLDRTLSPADPVASGRELRELSAQIGLSQQLSRFAEAALRYDVYQPDADATRQRGVRVVPRDTRYRTLGFALAGRYGAARLLLEYDHRRNALGRAANGSPTTLKDDALTLRAEVHF